MGQGRCKEGRERDGKHMVGGIIVGYVAWGNKGVQKRETGWMEYKSGISTYELVGLRDSVHELLRCCEK